VNRAVRISAIVLAAFSALINLAHGEQVQNKCFAVKRECMASCLSSKDDKEGCIRKCQVDMEACKASLESDLKTASWKKRCLSLPNEERYFVDVIALAWRRASAVLRAQSLLLGYVERRIRLVGAAVDGPSMREISSLVSTLDVKNLEFMSFFNLGSDDEPGKAEDVMYREISSGQSAFDVLSNGAARLVVSALLKGAEDASSLPGNTQALTNMAHNFDEAVEKHSDTASAREALLRSLTNLESQINSLLSKTDSVKSSQEAQEPRQLLNEVKGAQRKCESVSPR
jgi:hypothetical protein